MPPKKRFSSASTVENERRRGRPPKSEQKKQRPTKIFASKAEAPRKMAENPAPSYGVKEQFWRYVYEHRYLANRTRAKTKQKSEDLFREKIEIIKRIEKATQDQVKEILTFEFFNFSSALSSVGEDVAAEIFLLSFNGQQVPDRIPLFRGPLPLRSEKDKRVVYFNVPPSFTETSSVYLVAKVDVVANVAHSRRAKATEDAVEGSKETFWGTKSVSRSGRSSFEPIYGSSSINLVCPTVFQTASSNRKLLEENWFHDKSAVAGLEAETKKLQGKLASTSMPRVDYELTDQHCDEDWDEIREGMKKWEERTTIKDGNATAFILEGKPPEKENESPTRVTPDPRLLLELPYLRCPFTGMDFESEKKLLNHLNATFSRLQFVQKDESTVIVRIPSEEVVEGAKESEETEKNAWPPGPLPLNALAFYPPREDSVTLSSNFTDATRHVPHGSWKRNLMHQLLDDDETIDETTRKFMQLANDNMLLDNSTEALGPAAVRKAFLQFVTSHAQMLVDQDMDLLALTMALKLQKQSILTAQDYTDLFEILANID